VRPVDRILGRDTGKPASFAVRPFGTSAAEAQAIAASATAAGTGSIAGTTGGAGSAGNMTTSSYSGSSRDGSARP
jgi:hypothetical protein